MFARLLPVLMLILGFILTSTEPFHSSKTKESDPNNRMTVESTQSVNMASDIKEKKQS
jgi:hypothetical protein